MSRWDDSTYEKRRDFYMFGQPAELVIRVKHSGGGVVEVPVSDVAQFKHGGDGLHSLTIPLHGQWFDRLVETTDFAKYKSPRGFR